MDRSPLAEGTYSRAVSDIPLSEKNPQLDKNLADVMDFFDQMAAMDPLTRQAPKFISDAENRLRETAAGKRAGSGGQALVDMALVGGYRIYRAGMKFAEWSREMIRVIGERVRPYLRDTWEKVSGSFSTGALPGETTGGQFLGSGLGSLQGTFGKKQAGKPAAAEADEDLTFRERLGRQIGTAQTAAQLLNPKTIAQNIIGNAAFTGAKNVATLVAVPFDAFLSLKSKQRQVATPELRGQFEDFKRGFADVYHAVRTGDYASLADNRYELSNERAFKNKIGGFFEDALNIALRGPDRGTFLAAYNESVQQILKAHAKSKQKFSLDKIHDQAKLEAQQSIFQDDNLISNVMVGLRQTLNKISPFGEKANFGLADVIGLKYVRTPAGLLARGIEYSPLSFAKAFYKAGKVFAGLGKDFDQREASLAFGKAFVGSAFGAGLGALLYEMGVITQPEQEDRGVQAAERAEGLTGYQINLSALKRYAMGGLLDVAFDGDLSAGKKQAGDTLMSYDWFQPWAFALGMGAAARDAMKRSDGSKSALEETLTQVDAVTTTLTDQSILRNVRDIGRYGLASTGRKIITDTPASFVPSLLNQTRQIIDDRARETSREQGAKGMSREALEKVLNRLPVASKRLPVRTDIVGRQVPSRLPGATGAVVVPFPGRFSEYRPHEVLGEMQRLETGSTGIRRKEGETEGQFKARRALAQQWLNEYGLRLVRSERYRSASRAEQQRALEYLRSEISAISTEEGRPSLWRIQPFRVMERSVESVRRREREERRKARGVAR